MNEKAGGQTSTVPPLVFGPLQPRTLIRDRVFDQLASDIVAGRLSPMEAISDADLQSDYGVSRTPIREAINRLTDLDLIEVSANRYTRVAPIDPNLQWERAATAQTLVGGAALRVAAEAPDAVLCALADDIDALHRVPDGANGLSLRWYELFERMVAMSGNSVASTMLEGRIGLHLRRSVQTIPPVCSSSLPARVVDGLRDAFRNRECRSARDFAEEAFSAVIVMPLKAPDAAAEPRQGRPEQVGGAR